MGAVAALFVLILMIAPVVTGVVLIIIGARRRGKGYPACGQCGYDVSGTLGTTTARCPECGGEFGIVGILPAAISRNKPMIFGGLALVLAPMLCFGAMLAPVYTARSRAVVAAQQARASAIAAQQAASLQVNLQAANAEFLIDPPTAEQSQPWRDRIQGWSRQQVDDRLNAVWLDMASDAANQPEKRAQLRAEAQALSERIVAGAPPEVRDYIATPLTQERIDALTRDELQRALAANSQAQQWARPYAAMQTRVQAEFAALQAAAMKAAP